MQRRYGKHEMKNERVRESHLGEGGLPKDNALGTVCNSVASRRREVVQQLEICVGQVEWLQPVHSISTEILRRICFSTCVACIGLWKASGMKRNCLVVADVPNSICREAGVKLQWMEYLIQLVQAGFISSHY